MGILGPIYNLLGTGPGTFVYHLLILLALEGAAGIALVEYRRTHNPDQWRFCVAFTLILALRLPLLILGPQGYHILAPLLYALEVASLTVLSWAFVAPILGRRVGRWFLLIHLAAVLGVVLLFFPLWYPLSQAVPFLEYTTFWQQTIWDLWATVLALATGLFLLSRRRGEFMLPGVAFGVIAIGNGFITADQAGLGRLINLLGYPLISVIVYRAAIQDLWAYRQELQTLSERSLQQTRELVSLLEVGRVLSESLDLERILKRVVEQIAQALDADRVAVLLRPPEEPEDLPADHRPERLRLMALYVALLGHQPLPDENDIPLSQCPLLAHGVYRRRHLVLHPRHPQPDLQPLYELVQSPQGGPAIVQPIVHRERTVGVLVVVNDQHPVPFGSREVRLCESIAAQMGAVIENVYLYLRLERQVRRLGEVLQDREREASLREAILESTAEGIIVTDERGIAIRMNAAAEDILGVPRERLLGRPIRQALESLASPNMRDLGFMQPPLQTLFELEGKHIAVSAAPVRLSSGEQLGTVAVLRDVTREVQAEKSKREFIAHISHELRTPLTAILGYAEALYSGMVGPLAPTQSTFIHIIHDNARRLVTIANNLIAMAESERGHLELHYAPTDLALVLGEVLEAYIPQMKARQLEWRLEVADHLPVVEADPLRIRQVVNNLVSNAVKFTYPGGRVTVGAAPVPEPGEAEPRFCRIWVQDTGIGIPVEEQPRIWERFYCTDDPLRMAAGGLGVGLSIVRSLVEAHGGRVWLESAPGQGSTFTVLLPIRRASPPATEEVEGYPVITQALGEA
ncbi:MAG: ATP-binding protein [Anaerolineae bacterium]|nr:ATP-binding protein [Anaerolineae bacterium]MDW8068600.1 ATP-binding protein [Anaerolineae bacterium]